ncbi:MAG: competence/damage-inducible protein A [Vampirovibrionales bacterium]|nr:competence/damage-inducible protein A [Vampirovibrionales bacterium]
MRAEILAIGTELLLGETINSNAAWLSRELSALGIDVYHHQTVGDNPARIIECVQQAMARSAVLITTGGLGPTDDDLTVQTLADCYGAPMVHHPALEAQIRLYFEKRGLAYPAINHKQALLPTGALPVQNPLGTAPGMWWDVSAYTGQQTSVIATFPGVPKELYIMWPQVAERLKALQEALGEQPQQLYTCDLWFVGIGESGLAGQLKDLMAQSSPSVAPYVANGQVRIRVACKAASVAEAQAAIAPVKAEVLKRVGGYCIYEGQSSLEAEVGRLLVAAGQTVALAESCTGGLVSSRLTDVPGSSAYVMQNVVTYSNVAKTRLLNVPEALLAEHGAVSEPVAQAMAEGVLSFSGTDWGLSITGIAGAHSGASPVVQPTGHMPEGPTEKPVGTAYIAIAGKQLPKTIVKRVRANANAARADIKYWFSQYALLMLKQALEGQLSGALDEWCAL